MVRINWTQLAVEDLRSIAEYISRDSKKYAEIQVRRIKGRTKILRNNPKAGPRVPEFEDRKYRQLIEGSYRIVYKIIDDERIDVLRVHQTSRDLTKRKL